MKKIILPALAAVSMISVAACDSSAPAPEATEEAAVEEPMAEATDAAAEEATDATAEAPAEEAPAAQ